VNQYTWSKESSKTLVNLMLFKDLAARQESLNNNLFGNSLMFDGELDLPGINEAIKALHEFAGAVDA
jgi:hypothetical protein